MIPKRLKKGDTIGIVAPSNPLNEEHKKYLENYKRYIEEEVGLKVVLGKNIFKLDKFGNIETIDDRQQTTDK